MGLLKNSTIQSACCLVWCFWGTVYAYQRGVDQERIELEKKIIADLVTKKDIPGLVGMLEDGPSQQSQALAAQHLGYIGDERALERLNLLNHAHGGWEARWREDHFVSGNFAVAICQILNRDKTKQEQVTALFELLQGKGPGVPEAIHQYGTETVYENGQTVAVKPPAYTLISGYVASRAAQVLSEFDDPRIVPYLRQSRNTAVAPMAVWLEVRGMQTDDAINRCLSIIDHDPVWQQRQGAMACLRRFGDEGLKALQDLVSKGYKIPQRFLEEQTEAQKGVEKPTLSMETCISMLSHTDASTRCQAVSGLMGYARRSEVAVLGLIEVLDDPNQSVRQTAANSLRNSLYYWKTDECSNEVIEKICGYAEHDDPDVARMVNDILLKHDWNTRKP